MGVEGSTIISWKKAVFLEHRDIVYVFLEYIEGLYPVFIQTCMLNRLIYDHIPPN